MAKKVDVEVKEEKSLMEKIGPWAFILGLAIALVSAITGQVFWVLGLLGLIVGLLNITDQEVTLFLLATLTFMVSANALSTTLTNLVDLVPLIGDWLGFINPLLANVTLFVAPGAAVVALRALYDITRD